MKRASWISLAFVIASIAPVAWFWSRLPDPYPTHWNWRGEADGFTPMPWGALLLPFVQIVMWVVLTVAPWLSPKKFGIDFTRALASLIIVINGFFALLSAIALASALGHHSMSGRMMPALVGALLVGIGNYLSKTTPNFFIGVRTPWTLASPVVWERTHRLASWMFVATGLVVMLVAALTARGPFALLLVLVPALVPAAYSFVLYRRLEGSRKDESA
jgi:uncharacterized membrane protein